jgi:hypothetical protein
MKCSIFSLSLLQSIFASFLNICIRLLWSMYEPVSNWSFGLVAYGGPLLNYSWSSILGAVSLFPDYHSSNTEVHYNME